MSGETDLDVLLKTLSPSLQAPTFVFCCVRQQLDVNDGLSLSPFAVIFEAEGTTFVINQAAADRRGWPYNGTWRCITLTVHSSLEAVGLTAAVATKLAKRGISANVIAAYHHDHILVPADRAHDALEALNEFATGT